MRLRKGIKKVSVVIMSTLTICVSAEMSVCAAVNNGNVCTVESNTWKGWPQAPDISCGTGVLMDAGTGQILYNKGMYDQRYPASITKVMTSLVAIENSNLDAQVTFTETGMADAYSGSSNIIPQLGETFTMEQCIYMIMLKSANDVSTQVAETIGGSVENFIDMMNQKAAELGCTNTHFNNASGLPDENHYTSAHDMALIAQAALQNETFRQVVSTPHYVVPSTNLSGARDYTNHHKMMLDGERWYYDGCIGGKTGYTDASLSTLVTFSSRDGMDLIAVVMYGLGDDAVYEDTRQLLDYGYANFKRTEEGMVQTVDGKYVYENQILTEAEYQEAIATPTPTEEPIEVTDKTNFTNEEVTKQEQTERRAGLGVYITIGVLAALILLGIILIIVSAVHQKKRRRQ